MVTLPDADQVFTIVFHCPTKLLNAVEHELAKRPKESNIVYAHAYKLSRLKQQQQQQHQYIAPNQFWIACYSTRRYGDPTGVGSSSSTLASSSSPVLDFVVSCTEGSLGTYPLFIYSNHPASASDNHAFLEPRMTAIANTLLNQVPTQRVFSVFSLTAITRAFAAKWSALTGSRIVQGDPWYSATSSYCTLSTFRGARSVSECNYEPGHSLRRASWADLDECAALCQEFASTSPPFTLTRAQAKKEAEELIRNNQLWVYQLPSVAAPHSSSSASGTAISTIVAVTRSTPTVSAITKVYTTAVRKENQTLVAIQKSKANTHMALFSLPFRHTENVALANASLLMSQTSFSKEIQIDLSSST